MARPFVQNFSTIFHNSTIYTASSPNPVLWCNGSTIDFGSVRQGSSPCGTTINHKSFNIMDNNNIEYIISEDNIRIENSYVITTEDYIELILTNLKNKISDHIVFQKRTIKSLTKEWIAHNVLYKLHIARSHTKSVDLNIESWYRIWCYNIIYFIDKLLNYFV